MTALFVTGTGTGVGKTFVTAGLIAQLPRAGRRVDALKPIVSGFDPDDAAASDPGLLLAALGRPLGDEALDDIAPWRFAAPLSPDMAAAREGRALDFDAVVAHSRRRLAARADVLLIEGVGGAMVPIDERHTVLDWMTLLRVPALVVAGSYLGTLSHTLTALHVIAQRHLDIAAVVISESEGATVPLDDTVTTVARFAGGIPVVGLARLPPGAAGHPAFAQIAKLV
jgi:dethiobiotin synthetase